MRRDETQLIKAGRDRIRLLPARVPAAEPYFLFGLCRVGFPSILSI
jgi:hypothetical protein